MRDQFHVNLVTLLKLIGCGISFMLIELKSVNIDWMRDEFHVNSVTVNID